MAQGKSDGTVIIDTLIDTSGIGKGIETVKNKIGSVTNSVKKFGDYFKKSFTEAPTGNAGRTYEEVARDIKKAEAQLDKLIEKQIRFVEIGGNRKSQTFAGMEYDIEMARNRLFELQEELSKTSKKAPKSMNVLKKGVDNTTKSIKKMGNTAKKSSYSLLKMLGTSLLFSMVFRAISTVTQGFVDGLNNLVQYSDEANSTISSLKSSLTQLKNSFATAFMPIINFVAPALNKLISMIVQVNNLIAQFFSALSGKSTYTKAIAVQEDYAESLDKTADSAKKAQKYLSGLDEIRTFTDTEENKSTEVSPQNMFEEVAIDSSIFDFIELIKKIIPRMKELVGLFKEGFAEGLGDTEYRLQSLKDSVASIKDSFEYIFDENLVDGFNATLDQVAFSLGEIGGAFTSVGLTLAANLLGGFSGFLEDEKPNIQSYLLSMFDIQGQIIETSGELSSAFAYIFEVFAGENGQQVTEDIFGIFFTAFSNVSLLAATFSNDIYSFLATPFINSKEEIKTALEDLLSGISDFTSSVRTTLDEFFELINQFYTEHISPIFENLIPDMENLWKEHLSPLVSKFGEFFSNLGENITYVWEEVLKPWMQWFSDNIGPVITPILENVGRNFINFFGTIADVIGNILDILGGLIDFVVGVFTRDWEKAWGGIVNVFKGIVNTLASLIEGFVNSAINTINGLIGGVNAITSNIGIPAIPTIPEFNIPMLATGTVIPPNAPFMAVLGDQRRGTNIEAPLSTIESALDNVLNRRGGASGNMTLHNVVQINRRTLLEEMIEEAKLQKSTTGRNIFDLS